MVFKRRSKLNSSFTQILKASSQRGKPGAKIQKIATLSLGCTALSTVIDANSVLAQEFTATPQSTTPEHSEFSRDKSNLCNLNRFNQPSISQSADLQWSRVSNSTTEAILSSYVADQTRQRSDVDYPLKTLGIGERGAAVKYLQEHLKSLGLPVAVDGIFGAETQNAVACLQRFSGLREDGIADPKTLQVLAARVSTLGHDDSLSTYDPMTHANAPVTRSSPQLATFALDSALAAAPESPGNEALDEPLSTTESGNGTQATVFNTDPFVGEGTSVAESDSSDGIDNANDDESTNTVDEEVAPEDTPTVFNTAPFIAVVRTVDEPDETAGKNSEETTPEPSDRRETPVIERETSTTVSEADAAVDESSDSTVTTAPMPDMTITNNLNDIAAQAENAVDDILANAETIGPEVNVTSSVTPIVQSVPPASGYAPEKSVIILLESLTATEALPQLISLIKDPSNELQIRQDAILALAYVDSEQATTELMALLDSDNEDIRQTAVVAMSQVGSSALPELNKSLHRVLQSASLSVEEKAISASKISEVITSIQNRENNRDTLAPGLQDVPKLLNTPRLLERLTSQEVFPQLVEIAKDSRQDSVVRLAAIDQLSQYGCSPGCYFCNSQGENN
jgi:peptidoglycan hydrolase-like protein with peptidoglycan-binding domain